MRNQKTNKNKLLVLLFGLLLFIQVDLHSAATEVVEGDVQTAEDHNRELARVDLRTDDEKLDYDRECCRELQRAFSAVQEDENGQFINRCDVGKLPHHLRQHVREYLGFDGNFIARVVVSRMVRNQDISGFLLNSVPEDGTISVVTRYVRNKYRKLLFKLEKVLEWHEGSVNCLCLDRDGNLCSSGSDGGKIRVWDTVTGECKQVLEGHEGSVNCLCLDRDGNLCSAGDSGKIRVWDTVTGECKQALEGYEGAVTSLCLDRGGNLCSAGDSGKIRVWDTVIGKCKQVLEGHEGFVNCLCLDRDGNLCSGVAVTSLCLDRDGNLYSSGEDGSIRVWDTVTGECKQVLEGHEGFVNCLCLDRDGNLCSGGYGGSIRVWDTVTGECKQVLEGHEGAVWSLCLDRDGNLYSGGYDGSIQVWDTVTGEYKQVLEGHRGFVNCLCLDRDGNLCSGGYDGFNESIRVWKANEHGQYWSSLELKKLKNLQELLFDYDVNIDNIIIALNEDNWLSKQPNWLQAVVEKRISAI